MIFTKWQVFWLTGPFWIGVAAGRLCGTMTWWKAGLVFLVGVVVTQVLRRLLESA